MIGVVSNSYSMAKQFDETVALDDSIALIIKQAEIVTARVLAGTENGRFTDDSLSVNLSKRDMKAMKKYVLDSKNQESKDTVLGVFVPSVCFDFKYKDALCRVQFDFGLGKWSITDVMGNQLYLFNCKGQEAFDTALSLFPDNQLLLKLNEKRRKK